MATDDAEHQPRATTASIDRRVERLELLQAETDRKVDSLAVKVEHVKELMDLKFTGIEQTLQAQGVKLDAFILRIDALITEGLKQQTDLDLSPLGRQINRRLTELESKVDVAESYVEGAKGFGSIVAKYILPTVAVLVSAFAVALQFFPGP